MNIKRIIFMGGKPIGDAILELINDDPNIEYKGYGYNDKVHINHIKSFKPDLIVCAYYDYILPKEIIDIPKYGCINVHLADAERYRGCYPTTRAILNGDTDYGVTIHQIDEGIDTGDILYKTNFKIPEYCTGKELYDMATAEGIEAFKEFWPKFKAGEILGLKQTDDFLDNRFVNPYPRKFPDREVEACSGLHGESYDNEVLAFDFPPYEGAYIMIGDKKYKLVRA